MGNSSKKDKREKDTQKKILRKLKSIEKRIKTIETSIERAEKSSALINEDQLFFGLVLSLALLLITLPDFDVCTLFENFGFKIEATTGIITSKVLLVALLILASGTRYAATLVKEDTRKNKLRMSSVGFVIMSLYWLVTDLFFRGLTSVFKSVNVFLIFVPPVMLTVFSIFFGKFVEKKWYRYYDFEKPIVSIAFGWLGLVVVVAYYLGMIVSFFIPLSGIVGLLVILASAVITILSSRLSSWTYGKLSKLRKKLPSSDEKEG